MLDPYENDTQKPLISNYEWEPTGPANGNYAAFGFSNLTINKGEFRNDVPVCAAYSETSAGIGVKCSVVAGSLGTESDSENWPFYSSFRPFAKPTFTLPSAKGVLRIDADSAGELGYQIELFNSGRISAITIEYSLVFDPSDITAALYTVGFNSNNIAAYKFMKVMGYTGAEDTGTEYPAIVSGVPVELQVTDVASHSNPASRKTTIKFGEKSLPSGYPFLKYIKLLNRYSIKSLKLYIHKIMVFNAKAVNFTPKQLPCKLLQYAFEFDYPYRPENANPLTIIPSRANNNNPSMYIKIFDPEDTSGTIGFAHCINFYLQVFSLPIPAGPNSYSLAGVLYDMTSSIWFQTVFVGPKSGVKNLKFALTASPVINSSYRVVLLDQEPIDKSATNLLLQKAQNYHGSTAPGSSVTWLDLSEYSLNPVPQPNGLFIREFLYRELAAVDEWYRIKEQTASSQKSKMPFQNHLCSENVVFGMVDSVVSSTKETITRRVYLSTDSPPLSADPMAVFVAQDGAPIATSVEFQKGAWKLNIKAKSEDSNMYVNTHVFARFWFQPEDVDLSPSNPHHYRSQTEFCFKYANEKTTLTKGSPISLDDVIITPPLTQDLTSYELFRYVDGFSDQNWTIPFANGVRANLVVALYSVSYLNPEGVKAGINKTTVNSPKVILEINGQDDYFETTISQVLSNQIIIRKVLAYNSNGSSKFQPVSPLCLTKHRVSMTDLIYDPLTYNSKYVASPKTGSALDGLLVLQSESEGNIGVTIPYSAVAETNDKSKYASVDFCTNGKSLASGRVDGGDSQDVWTFTISKYNIPIQDAAISVDYSVEAFLVSSSGSVVERIFKTESMPITTSDFSVPINTSFIIGNIDVQLVIRLTLYPYSADGKAVDLNKLKEDMGTSVVGLKIKQFCLSHTTLCYLDTTSVNNVYSGSPSFYENLPTSPNSSFGGQDLYLVMNPENLKIAITFPDMDWNVAGTLYGPTWFIDWKDKNGLLVEDMEVSVLATGYGTSDLKFRTVPTTQGAKEKETSISAAENKLTGNTDIIHDEVATVSSQSMSMLEDVSSFRRRSLDDPMTPSFIKTAIAKTPDGQIIRGRNASVSYVNHSSNFNEGNILGVIYDTDGGQDLVTKSVIDANFGVSGDFIVPNENLQNISIDKTGSLSKNFSYSVLLQTNVGRLSYIFAWYKGYLIAKEVSLFDTPEAGYTYGGINYIIDGDQTEELSSDSVYIMPQGSLNGKVKETYPGVLFTNDNNIIVAYAIDGQDGILYGRTGRCFGGYGVSQELISFRQMGVTGSSNLTISSPVLYNNNVSNVNYIAFYCGGKILMACLTGSNIGSGAIFGPLQLVAGSKDFSVETNSANSAFAYLLANNKLQVKRTDGEDDVTAQKVGFLIGSKSPHTGALFVYYKDSQDKYKVRRIYDNGWVSSPVSI